MATNTGRRRSHQWIAYTCICLLGLLVLQDITMIRSTQAAANYRAYADSGIAALQNWYTSSSGLYSTTSWWNSANALETVIDYSRQSNTTTYRGAIGNTFDKNSSGNFLNEFYDDEGWWALTWIKAYDLTGEVRYLNMAKTIFNDMKGGWDNTCGGGVWWTKSRDYKNAIPNELFLTIAARLHQRTPGDSGNGSYIDWATRTWNWFNTSGMINSSNMINDGLTSSCQNNGQTTWTYNQGVILGGLVEMYKITNDSAYLTKAKSIANAAIATLVHSNGVLREPCEPANCGADGPQFKGIFMRNLAYLYTVTNDQAYKDFITRNVEALWLNARNGSNQIGLVWVGPFDNADATRQSSAQDALNAAIPFSTSGSGTNLALNKTATADSSCSANESASKAFDGSVTNNSKWCSGGTSGQYWLKVDLGATSSLTSFTIQHAGAGGENTAWNTRDFTIQISNDNSSWSTVATITGNTSSTTTHPITATNARYVRLNITNPQTDTQNRAARIYEFEVYGTTNSQNLALNKSASANGSCGSAEGPEKAFDGSTTNNSKWCAGATGGQYWLQVDLGATTTVSRFVLKHAGAGGENTAWNTRDFTLQVSTTGSSWSTVVTVTGNTSNTTTHNITATSARYVRLNITNPQTDTQNLAARIYEFEVYSN